MFNLKRLIYSLIQLDNYNLRKMDSKVKNKSITQPKTLAELLPEICGILSKDAVQTLMSQNRHLMVQSRTAEKVIKPMFITEMKTGMLELRSQSSSKLAQPTAPMEKMNWISSVKVGNKSHTADGQMKYNSVRKVLNFQPKAQPSTRATMMTSETPIFPKPEIRAKKSLHILETPISNISFESNSDASFLEIEKIINDIEEMTEALTEESTLENIAEVSPPVSTPFKRYSNVQEFFNNTADSDNSAVYNDTVTCFEKMSVSNEYKREESIKVFLCDMLNKATVNSSDNISTELDYLLEVERQTENNIEMIKNGIKSLKHMEELQLKSLQSVRKLINEKKMQKVSESDIII